MKNKETYLVEMGKNEIVLIGRALELYARVAMCQFNNLTDCYSLGELVHDKGCGEAFDEAAKEMKKALGLPTNGYYGIGKKPVGDDARIAFDIYQSIRHERWKRRGSKEDGSTSCYPADVCRVYGMDKPNFEIK
jgi:hypothetical protein